jgi:hypothetical protein
MIAQFLVCNVFVIKANGKIICVFSEKTNHEKVLTEEITKKLSIYNLTAFPMAVQAFVFHDGQIELFTANKL